jgi:hypothetical protein
VAPTVQITSLQLQSGREEQAALIELQEIEKCQQADKALLQVRRIIILHPGALELKNVLKQL